MSQIRNPRIWEGEAVQGQPGLNSEAYQKNKQIIKIIKKNRVPN